MSKESTGFFENIKKSFLSFFKLPEHRVDEDEISKYGLKWPLLFIYFSSFLLAFLYLFISGYYSDIETKFLAPVSTDPNCESVLLPNSGTYIIDSDGYWDTDPNFHSGHAKYEVQLTAFQGNISAWNKIIDRFEADVSALAARAATEDLAWNMVAYGSYDFQLTVDDDVGIQAGSIDLYLSGDVSDIFNFEIVTSGVASVKNESSANTCAPGLFTSVYNKADVVIDVKAPLILREEQSLAFNISVESLSNAEMPCEIRGLSEYWLEETSFSTKFDIRSIVSAVAINEGITSLDTMSIVQEYAFLKVYVDEYYYGMDPIICGNYGGRMICYILNTYGFFLPYIVQTGVQTNSSSSNSTLCGETHAVRCEGEVSCAKSVVFGLFAMENIDYVIKDYLEHKESAFQAISSVANYMHKRSKYQINDVSDFKAYEQRFSQECGDFNDFLAPHLSTVCSGQPGSMFVFQFEDTVRTWHRTDFLNFSFPLNDRCAAATFIEPYNGMISDTALFAMRTPPVELEQQYSICHKSPNSALVDAFGIALSNAQLACEVILAGAVAVAVFAANKFFAKDHFSRIISPSEKAELHKVVTSILVTKILESDALKDTKSNKDVARLVSILKKIDALDQGDPIELVNDIIADMGHNKSVEMRTKATYDEIVVGQSLDTLM